ncbi:MAG: acyl-CoA dehydrogenase family protein [Acidimicrobiales bacterium]
MLDFALSPELEALRARARAVAEEGVAAYGVHTDSWINGYSAEFSKVLAANGWIGMTWPTEVGGEASQHRADHHGRGDDLGRCADRGELVRRSADGARPHRLRYTDQQAEFLPGMLSGETTWCIGMSEPDAGSDLARLATSARRDGSHWVINGQKIWTSFAAVADYCYLICRTSTEGPPHRGVSEIIVPMDLPGIESPAHRGHDHQPALLRGVLHRCAGADRESGGRGGRCVQADHGAARARARRHRPARLEQAALRPGGGRGRHRRPRVRQEIAQLEIGYRLGRLLVYREALKQAPAGFSAATKCFCTEHEQRVADFAARTLGMAATADPAITRAVAYAPAYTIMGGTSNIMRNILGERLLGLPASPAPDPATPRNQGEFAPILRANSPSFEVGSDSRATRCALSADSQVARRCSPP